MLDLRTLGSLELRADGSLRLAGRRKPLALLAYLARHAGSRLSREPLAAMLWDEGDRVRARQSLRQALSELRSVVGDALDSEGPVVRLERGVIRVDAATFETFVSESRFVDAVRIWSGDFLETCDDIGSDGWRGWLDSERASLQKRLAIAFEHLISAAEGRGDWKEAVRLTTQWRDTMPWDELAWRRLINALSVSGNTTEAAALHAAGSQILRNDYELELSAEFTRLGQELQSRQPTGTTKTAGADARAFASPDMLGRSSAFEALTNAWNHASTVEHAGTAVMVLGADGLGKTRLLDEFVRLVRRDSSRVIVIQTKAFASEHDRALSTLRPAINLLAREPAIAGAPPESLASLAEVAPALREQFHHLPPVSGKHDLHESLASVLEAVAEEKPVLLAVDDVTEADDVSADLIASLIRRPVPGLLLALTAKPESLRASPRWRDLVLGESQLSVVELQPLERGDIGRMLSSMAPFAADDIARLSADLHRETGGIPSHALQLVGQIADRGVIAPDANGQWRIARDPQPADWSLPATARDAIQARLDRLSPPARKLADVISIVGPSAPVALLENVSLLKPEDFRTALGELLVNRMVRESASARDHYELANEATRNAVHDLLPPSERERLHFAAWRVLQSAPRSSAGDPVEIARHRELAGSVRRKLTMRRVSIAAGLLVLVAVGAASVMRARKPVIKSGTQVLIADVQNLTGDSVLGKALLTAATVGLQQSQYISVFPHTRLPATLALMKRAGADTVITESLAREVAVRENVGLVLELGISGFDNAYLLTARAIDPASGHDLFTAREKANSRREILTSLDHLLSKIRRDIGESSATVSAASDLPRVTTSSLEALRHYSQGQSAWTARKYADAADAWKRAIALDSTFALALSSMASYGFFMNDQATGNAYLDRAIANSARLTSREQLSLKITTARFRGPEEEELRLSKQMAETWPSRDSWSSYGTTLMRHDRCDLGIPALRKALELDPRFTNAQINLATCYKAKEDWTAAVQAYDAALRIDSTSLFNFNLNHEWGGAVLFARGLAAAESVFVLMVKRKDDESKSRGFRSLAYLRMLEGKLKSAVENLDSAIAISTDVSLHRNLMIRGDVLITAGDTAAARATLRRGFEMQKTLSLSPFFLMVAGHVYARAGLKSFAMSNKEKIIKSVTALRRDSADMHFLNAFIASYAGRHREALRETAQIRDTTRLPFIAAIRGDAYAALHKPDSALAEARKVADQQSFGWEPQDEWLRAKLRVARNLAALGDTAAARAAYSEFADRWKNGDPTTPDLIEARRAIAR